MISSDLQSESGDCGRIRIGGRLKSTQAISNPKSGDCGTFGSEIARNRFDFKRSPIRIGRLWVIRIWDRLKSNDFKRSPIWIGRLWGIWIGHRLKSNDFKWSPFWLSHPRLSRRSLEIKWFQAISNPNLPKPPDLDWSLWVRLIPIDVFSHNLQSEFPTIWFSHNLPIRIGDHLTSIWFSRWTPTQITHNLQIRIGDRLKSIWSSVPVIDAFNIN